MNILLPTSDDIKVEKKISDNNCRNNNKNNNRLYKNQLQMSATKSTPMATSTFSVAASIIKHCVLMLLLLIFVVPDFIVALKDVSVTIPQAVKRGSNALLTCNYDMENDTLYSVKWYKGRREFYRYTPKENPAMKVFTMTSGLNVERNLSNQSHLMLSAVALNISGKFTCEISVEAPSFQTAMVSGEMEVVELPEEHATVTGIQPRYRIGDLVDGNCSIKFSKPAANLTWTINGIVVPPHHIKTYHIEKHEENALESVMSAIHFMVTTQHFLKGQMRLKCVASIFDIFKEELENIIEEDRPRIMASGRSYDINNYPYEQHSSGDGFEDHNESYLTYYSAADSSASSAASVSPATEFLMRKLRALFSYFISSPTTTAKSLMKLTRKLQQNLQDSLRYISTRLQSTIDEIFHGKSASASAAVCFYCNNKFDVWQLCLAAAVSLWLAHLNNINNNDSNNKKDNKKNIEDDNKSLTIANIGSASTLVKATMTTKHNESNKSNNRKCFYNCQCIKCSTTNATVDITDILKAAIENLYFIDCLQQEHHQYRLAHHPQQQQRQLQIQHQSVAQCAVAASNQTDSNIESANNNLTTACQQQLSMTLSTNAASSTYSISSSFSSPVAVADQTLLMTVATASTASAAPAAVATDFVHVANMQLHLSAGILCFC